MQNVKWLFIATGFLLSTACTNAVPETNIPAFADKKVLPAASISTSSDTISSTNYKLKFKLGSTVTSEAHQKFISTNYKIDTTGVK